MEVDFEELSIEQEVDEPAYVQFDISVSPIDPSLELLANKIISKEIIIPFYQRRYVWKIEQASKLVESFLMGLPVPQIFLHVNDSEELEVIDGQQRIMSIKYFFEGYFGEEDAKGKRQVFKLKGLSELSDYNDKTFSELSPKDQRRLKNSTLRAIQIKQLKPNSNDSVFHIFERLNTGGTQLKPQEIRNAVYRGRIVDELRRLNSNQYWQKILGLKKPDKNQKDVELVLRLFSLFRNSENYEKPMLRFLNNSMSANKNFDSERAKEFTARFEAVSKFVSENYEKPFRPFGILNAAMLEAIYVTLMEMSILPQPQKFIAKHDVMAKDEDFLSYIRSGTSGIQLVENRIAFAKKEMADEPT